MTLEICEECEDHGISKEIHNTSVCGYANRDIKEEHITRKWIPYYCKYSKEPKI